MSGIRKSKQRAPSSGGARGSSSNISQQQKQPPLTSRIFSLPSLFLLVLVLGLWLIVANLNQFPSDLTTTAGVDLNHLSLLGVCDDTQKKTTTTSSGYAATTSNNAIVSTLRELGSFLTGGGATQSAVEPFDLTVNQLQLIPFWDGALSESESNNVATLEDFLPVVTPDQIDFRFRLRALPSNHPNYPQAIRGVSAYQILAETAHEPHTVLWDSGKIANPDTVEFIPPQSIAWNSVNGAPLLADGTIVRWKVRVWDAVGNGPSSSNWVKFGVGPKDDGAWQGQWITHPIDMATLMNEDGTHKTRAFRRTQTTVERCVMWETRRPLPVARVAFDLTQENISDRNEIVGALLVATGLGMFSATMNGKRLSSSAVQDPPLTDFAQRISYRGYDVTEELKQSDAHAVGITLGSGWFDHRPVNGAIVFMDFMPKGSLTTVAQLHVTLRDGTTKVLIPTGTNGPWKMAKGALIESNLYTGEHTNLQFMEKMKGWDTTQPPEYGENAVIDWVKPQKYESQITLEQWRANFEQWAVHKKATMQPEVAPLGKLQPIEIPPVLPIRKIAPISTVPLDTVGTHSGRWLIDFGKAMSGVVRFEEGLPEPFVPDNYPRGHDFRQTYDEGTHFISLVYADSLEMSTGDGNMALVAGFGHHTGGERNMSKGWNLDQRGGPCFPKEDLIKYRALTQRDVFVVGPGGDKKLFSNVRQPVFSVHGFRFAEVCCTKEPPRNVYAIQYRTAYQTWGSFESSNRIYNGAYEMTKNALESNTIGLQSDCPHRERLQYGGDLITSSPAAMAMFDMSAFYSKIVRDFTDTQFSNGAYTVTSFWMELLDGMSVGGRGSGDTTWAAAPSIVTCRHLRHYGDFNMAESTLEKHSNWVDFLKKYWETGIKQKYGDHQNVIKNGPKKCCGLGDWLNAAGKDHWLTHHIFYLASARSVAYLARKLIDKSPDGTSRSAYESVLEKSLAICKEVEDLINQVFKPPLFKSANSDSGIMMQDIGLYTRIPSGENRCSTLKDWVKHQGSGRNRTWPGNEEKLFLNALQKSDFDDLVSKGFIKPKNKGTISLSQYLLRYRINTGIFGIKYTLMTLSDMGFHSLAMTKASGDTFPSFGMMLSFNATTLWETWWRSEDIYSRNHPMFGAVAEWLPEFVAGVSLSPTTTGGTDLLFWPRLPDTIETASLASWAGATQGTKRGEAAIAWKLEDSGQRGSQRRAVVRILVPPGSRAELRLPVSPTGLSAALHTGSWEISQAATFPDLEQAKATAQVECEKRRQNGEGFPYHWNYDRSTKTWSKVMQGQPMGTPCEHFLFKFDASWSRLSINLTPTTGSVSTPLQPGLYEAVMNDWKLEKDVAALGYDNLDFEMGPYCSDQSTFDWDVNDAEHLN